MPGALLATYPMGPALDSIVNDLITPEAVYVPDSLHPRLYKLPLGPDGALPADLAPCPASLARDRTLFVLPPFAEAEDSAVPCLGEIDQVQVFELDASFQATTLSGVASGGLLGNA